MGGLEPRVGDGGQRFHRGDHLSIPGECCIDEAGEAGVVTSGMAGISRTSENKGGGKHDNHSFFRARELCWVSKAGLQLVTTPVSVACVTGSM